MKLLVDVGNTRMKYAWLEGAELSDAGATPHGGQVPRQAIAALAAAARGIDEILVASVAAPAFTTAVATALAEGFGASVRVAETEVAAAGVRNGYVEPRQLGVDRWLALLAAYGRYRTAVCVVDAGTALTVDAVTADGAHLGGMIVPGPSLMRAALLRETGGIGSAAGLLGQARGGQEFWGRDTESCIRLGSWRSLASLVEACLKGLDRPGKPATLVVTGGDAPSLLPGLPAPVEHRPLLVLEGLALRHGGARS